jgi:hypothetical protein
MVASEFGAPVIILESFRVRMFDSGGAFGRPLSFVRDILLHSGAKARACSGSRKTPTP